ncbi:MAG: COX15/CtaA family protein [Thermoplasmata archaeon YP2-bin.285]|uniref:COX15/CtaA family protein n=1 Tax=Candidatus Sysuiplasma superficiale TaxID=2823368 RepID=A0A8J7YNP2_9ARCH|nr:COX15/CtaA family protein [Candidatus Sysuiplasma superficiale]
MKHYQITSILCVFTVWVEYVIAASVVFLDPSNNDFPYTRIVLTWPGVLEEIHRLWAAIIIVVFIANIVFAFTARRRNDAPSRLFEMSAVAFVLLLLQASFGAITIWNYDYPPFVVMHEGNAGLLLLFTAFLAAYALYQQPPNPRPIRNTQ